MGGDGFQMPRFFVRDADPSAGFIKITGEDFNHIKNVLRLKKNDEVTICDGKGLDYISSIDEIGNDFITASVSRKEKNCNEPPLTVTLYQGIPKSDKMDFIIQKCVELGAAAFVPVETERSVVRLDNPRDGIKKTERWRRISTEAAKQSKRGIIPDVMPPVDFSQALLMASRSELSIMPYENEKANGLNKIIRGKNFSNISVFIGPEGGFSDSEIGKAAAAGIIPVTLGPRILRTETAGLAAVTILMYELGDMGNI